MRGMAPISLQVIGTVHSTRTAPRDDDWDREQVYVEFDAAVLPVEALTGIETFSHVEILFHMDRVKAEAVERGAPSAQQSGVAEDRHPRAAREEPRESDQHDGLPRVESRRPQVVRARPGCGGWIARARYQAMGARARSARAGDTTRVDE
jgi:hypothetical protein